MRLVMLFNAGKGEIRVELINTGPVAECTVVDNASAPASIGPGRGLKIIDELTRSLGGRFEHKLGPRGSSSTLIFPFAGTLKPSSGEGVQECTAQILEEIPTVDERVRAMGCGAHG
jgi:hypothetical protein